MTEESQAMTGIPDCPEQVLNPATGVNWSDDEGVLKTLGMKGVALAVWQRTLPEELTTWLDQLHPEWLPVLGAMVAVEEVDKAIRAAALSAGAPQNQDVVRFAADVAHLSQLLAAVCPGAMLRLRLRMLADDEPSSFDLPLGRARLVCCYRGNGLQVTAAKKSESSTGFTPLPRGDVALFRGLLWPDRQPTGIVHRSAPSDKLGETRFVLTIEPADDTAGHC